MWETRRVVAPELRLAGSIPDISTSFAGVAQLEEALASKSRCWEFESPSRYQICSDGGIGRRASLRSMFLVSEGSSPSPSTSLSERSRTVYAAGLNPVTFVGSNPTARTEVWQNGIAAPC